MLPVPIEAEEHETQGLMGSDDNDIDGDNDVSTSLNNNNNNNNIPFNPSTSYSNEDNLQHTVSLNTNNKNKANRISRRDVNKRIQSYLRESDENCRESATLIAIVIIGLVVTGSVIGFLQIGHHDPSSIHKGSHASITHIDGESLPNSLPDWLKKKAIDIDAEVEGGTLDNKETLGIQPLYRNYLLQTIYEYSFQSAIRIDKNDPIFQHISMTYGGPWNVPLPPSNDDDNDDDNSYNNRKRLQSLTNDTDSDTEKIVFDDESEIEIISLENGRNDHTFSFGGNEGYKNNVNEWHCYIFEFANADKFGVNDYKFKITSIIDNFDMENGYDFIRIYINSQYKGETFTGKYDKAQFIVNFIDFKYLNDWKENDIPSFELCFNIITDETVTKKGFDITTKIEYENPEIVEWNKNTQCMIEKPSWRNPSRWDGSCGIGIATNKIIKCNNDLLQNLEIKRVKPGINNNNNNDEIQELDESGLYVGVCTEGETEIIFCNKMDCGDKDIDMNKKEIIKNPKLKYHYNGHGRIDPSYPDPFKIYQSTNTEINIDSMIESIRKLRDDIGSEYSHSEILINSVQEHNKMLDSKIRLGLKLVRSLILGDIFHVTFTGSSNTAGHDNLFMSSYPMQLQSILRPFWKDIGYKGAAFKVSNGAIGGAIGTDQMAWCIPQITGGNAERIDVIFWESIMNDAGSDISRKHTMEQHIRNSLSLYGGTYNGNMPNRPVWHSIIAGSNGDYPHNFADKKGSIYDGYKDLIEQYSDYGAGIIEFKPSLGLNPMKRIDSNNWNDEHFYVTWHPGPVGHRIYAEIIAYFYLDSALMVLNDIKKPINDLESQLNLTFIRPILEILDLLQDAPYKYGLPKQENGETKKCQPICIDDINSFCILGFNPNDNVYQISKYVINENKWKYSKIAGNPQPINSMNGGQASIDTKYGYKGNKNSGNLIISIKISGNNYLLIEKPYADWGGLNDIIKKMDNWFTAQIINVIDIIIINDKKQQKQKEEIMKNLIGKKLKCQTKNKSLWNKDIMNFGCVLKFQYAGKYHIAFSVNTDQDIPICVIASF